MALDQVTENLLKQYGGLKRAKELFEKDPSPNNVEARELILDAAGLPLYGASAGLAGRQLGDNARDNLTSLAGIVKDAATYGAAKNETYGKLSDEGKIAAYLGLLTDQGDIRKGLGVIAIERVAKAEGLEAILTKQDRTFSSKPKQEQISAYLKLIQKDKKLGAKLGEDKALQLSQAVEVYDAINTSLAAGKVDDAVNYVNQALGADLSALYRAEGNVAAAKATVQRVAMAQLNIAAGLMKDKSVAKDIEASIASAPGGYARAVGEYYAVKK